MNNKFTYLHLLLAFLFLSTGAFAQNVGDYQTANTGNWSDVTVWQTWNGASWVAASHTPTSASDPVNFKITIQSPHTITLDLNVTCYTVEVSSGATLAINDGGTFIGTFTQNQGASAPDMLVDNGGTLKVGGFDAWVSGTGTPTAVINGALTWTSGTISVPVTVGPAGLVSLSTDNDKTLDANFINNGVMNWSAGTAGGIFLPAGGGITFTNGSTGIINENFTGTRGFGGDNTDIFLNQGTVNKFSANTMNIGPVLNNTGIMQGEVAGNAGGFATFNGVSANTGTIAPGNGTNAALLTVSPTMFTGQTPTLAITLVNVGDVAGTNYDQAISSGAIDISGTTLKVTDLNSDPVGTSYTVLSSPSGITGTFAATSFSPTIGNLTVNATTATVQKISTLPLTWGDFNALALANNSVSLKWTTLQEENTSHFVVEYSTDGTNFSSIGSVAASGNTTQTTAYSFVQTNPSLHGTDFYRLQEVDLDGKINYSSIRAVSFKNGQVVKVLAIPNPVHDLLQLNVQGDGMRALFVDALGRTIHAWILQNGYQQVNVADAPAGEYQLIIYQNNQKIDAQHIIKF